MVFGGFCFGFLFVCLFFRMWNLGYKEELAEAPPPSPRFSNQRVLAQLFLLSLHHLLDFLLFIID